MIILSRSAGSQSLQIPEISFGAAGLGNLYNSVSDYHAQMTVRRALEENIRYFDSAVFYGGGLSLMRLGLMLGETIPDDLVLSIKVGRVLLETGETHKNVKEIKGYVDPHLSTYYYDYSRNGVERAFHQSFELLNFFRESLGWQLLTPEEIKPIVFVHDPGVAEHGENQPNIMDQVLRQAFPKLKQMQDIGLISAYGVGTNELGVCVEASTDPDISLFLAAGRFTLFCNGAPKASDEIKRDSERLPEFLSILRKYRKRKAIGAALGNSGLGYGDDTYNYTKAHPDTIKHRDAIYRELADFNHHKGCNITPMDLMVRFALDFEPDLVASVMSGPKHSSHVNGLVTAYGTNVPREFWWRLQEKGLINPDLQLYQPTADPRSLLAVTSPA